MGQTVHILAPGTGQDSLLPASVTLALQRMRQTWRLLGLVGLGMLAAVVVVCAVPLYAQVTMTAGLRSALSANSQNAEMVVNGPVFSLTPDAVAFATNSLNQEFERNLGPYLRSEQFSIQTPPFRMLIPGTQLPSGDQVEITGVDTPGAASHLHFIQGHMPASTSQKGTIEIALRTELASLYNWKIGTVIPIFVSYGHPYSGGVQAIQQFKLQLVGIFAPLSKNDFYWHGTSFLGHPDPNGKTFVADSLASNTALIDLFNQPPGNLPSILTVANFLTWSYTLDTSRIQINQLDALLQAMQTIQVDNANNQTLIDLFLQRVQTFLPSSALALYHDRLPIAQLPVMSLTLLVLCLTLFFVMLMVGLLLERQSGPLALLRSRGASGQQIFAALVTQAVILGVVALVIGPLLAILVVYLLAQYMLSPADQGALNVLSGDPVSLALSVGPYALAATCAMVLTMVLAVWSTANRDVLALRREAARSTHRPFWQRLNLDLLAVVIALLGAAFAFYLSNSNVLDSRARLLFLSPLTLLAALCVLLAVILILLRGFPWLLRAGAWLAARRRGVAPQIALAQMARLPQRAIRMTLLLALATAFIIFTLIFNASQAQRIQDVTDYQAMADFSGHFPQNLLTPDELARLTQTYQHLPGVRTAALGYSVAATAGGSALSQPIDFKAVDSSTFARTARWPNQDSSQSLTTLMQQLSAARTQTARTLQVPAIVDAAAWDRLHLTPGATFVLHFSSSAISTSGDVKFKVIAEVQHIPTANINGAPGVLVDYLSFSTVYMQNYSTSGLVDVLVNSFWLRSSDDPGQIGALRFQLASGTLASPPVADRRQMMAQLANEPLYRTLFGILLLGAMMALLLAVIGNLVASWLDASARLTGFAALRALGATPRQVAGTLAWELVIIYTAAILLGFFFGWLLSILVLPSLVFTSVLPGQVGNTIDAQMFAILQNTPPIQMVVPPALWITLGALIVLCILALAMMVRVVARPSMAQVLRLNED